MADTDRQFESSIYIETEDGVLDIKGTGAFVANMFNPLSQLLAQIVPAKLATGGRFEFRGTPKVVAPAEPGTQTPQA